jgi:hypothetical protein
MYNEAAGHFAAVLFQQRMRLPADREFVSQNFRDVWGHPLPDVGQQAVTVTSTRFSTGRASLQRSSAGMYVCIARLQLDSQVRTGLRGFFGISRGY